MGGDININSYTHFYCIHVNVRDHTLCMADCQHSQFKKLKSYVISGRSELYLKIYNNKLSKKKEKGKTTSKLNSAAIRWYR